MVLDLDFLPDFEKLVDGTLTVKEYVVHLAEKQSEYDKIIQDCMHARELYKLSYAEIAKISKVEREALLKRRKYKEITAKLIAPNSQLRIKLGQLVEAYRYFAGFRDELYSKKYTFKTTALNNIMKNKKQEEKR